MKRTTLLAVGMVLLIGMTGCLGIDNDNSEKANEIANSTGEDVRGVSPGGSYTFEVRLTEKNQIGLVKAQPPFVMEHSLERQNLIDRYQYLNDRNNVHHVYITGEDGDVISYFVAQGKVSSVNSKLTNDIQIVRSEACADDDSRHHDDGGCYFTVESPQMDGSYGTNGDAIFFFTTDGKYVQTNHNYVVSEQPLNINTPISLVQEVESDDEDDENDNSTEAMVVA